MPLPEPMVDAPPKRHQIIEGAAVVFNELGYEGASMSQIAERAGVSKGTLYNYFAHKSDLFAAFVERQAGDRVAWILQPADPDANMRAVLIEVARRLITAFMAPSFQTLHRIVLSEAAKFPHLANIYFENGHMRGCRELAGWLDVQSRRGRIVIDDPVLAAEQFIALCKTRLWPRRCLDVHVEPTIDDVDAIAEGSVAMFLNTYRLSAGQELGDGHGH